MDEITRRLKEDADAIDAAASPEFRARLDASLRSIGEVPPSPVAERTPVTRLWLVSSLTGLAAAVAVIALINWQAPADDPGPAMATTVPDPVGIVGHGLPLDVSTAEFAAPLEEELERLQADLEKARENVRRDMRFAF